jgi:hypothetical protein
MKKHVWLMRCEENRTHLCSSVHSADDLAVAEAQRHWNMVSHGMGREKPLSFGPVGFFKEEWVATVMHEGTRFTYTLERKVYE